MLFSNEPDGSHKPINGLPASNFKKRRRDPVRSVDVSTMYSCYRNAEIWAKPIVAYHSLMRSPRNVPVEVSYSAGLRSFIVSHITITEPFFIRMPPSLTFP